MSKTLMESLKESTVSMHDSAEGSYFQGYLAQGKLPQAVYAEYLGQLFLVHQFLENAMQRHSKNGNSMAQVITSEQMQVPFLQEDLAKFSVDTQNIKALPQTESLLNSMEKASEKCPEALLGFHYVLLGSKHGGKFVAHNIKASYGLSDGRGALYFDPYGTNFMSLWLGFKDSMNNLSLNQEEQSELCEAAKRMFQGVTQIGEALMPSLKVS